jgi:hypothetical protein
MCLQIYKEKNFLFLDLLRAKPKGFKYALFFDGLVTKLSKVLQLRHEKKLPSQVGKL